MRYRTDLLTVLHPRHKLAYFAKASWQPDWIDTARDILRAEFARSYPSLADDRDNESVVNGSDTEKVRAGLGSGAVVLTNSKQAQNIFDNLLSLAPPKTADLRDELDRYLATDPEQVTDVLQWWSDRLSAFPHLSRMALNYLTIPGGSAYICLVSRINQVNTAMSVDVERVFSRGRLVLSHVRNGLSAQSTRAILCLSYWSRLGLVKNSDSRAVAELSDVEGDGSDYEMEASWDAIV
jgi:hypothetical protein